MQGGAAQMLEEHIGVEGLMHRSATSTFTSQSQKLGNAGRCCGRAPSPSSDA